MVSPQPTLALVPQNAAGGIGVGAIGGVGLAVGGDGLAVEEAAKEEKDLERAIIASLEEEELQKALKLSVASAGLAGLAGLGGAGGAGGARGVAFRAGVVGGVAEAGGDHAYGMRTFMASMREY
jgi:hypothetical protein